MLEWFDLKVGDYVKVVFKTKKVEVVCKVKKVYSDYVICFDADANFVWLFASGVGSYFPEADFTTPPSAPGKNSIERKKYKLFKSTESQFNIGVI